MIWISKSRKTFSTSLFRINRIPNKNIILCNFLNNRINLKSRQNSIFTINSFRLILFLYNKALLLSWYIFFIFIKRNEFPMNCRALWRNVFIIKLLNHLTIFLHGCNRFSFHSLTNWLYDFLLFFHFVKTNRNWIFKISTNKIYISNFL